MFLQCFLESNICDVLAASVLLQSSWFSAVLLKFPWWLWVWEYCLCLKILSTVPGNVDCKKESWKEGKWNQLWGWWFLHFLRQDQPVSCSTVPGTCYQSFYDHGTETGRGKKQLGLCHHNTQAISTWFLMATSACDWWSLDSLTDFLIPYQPFLGATPEIQ